CRRRDGAGGLHARRLSGGLPGTLRGGTGLRGLGGRWRLCTVGPRRGALRASCLRARDGTECRALRYGIARGHDARATYACFTLRRCERLLGLAEWGAVVRVHEFSSSPDGRTWLQE